MPFLLRSWLARLIQGQGGYNHNSYKECAVGRDPCEVYTVHIRLSFH